MRLENEINRLLNDQDIRGLIDLLTNDPPCKEVKAELTKGGQRIVTVEGREGSVNLHALAEQVYRFINSADPNNQNFNRASEWLLRHKIYQFYEQTDKAKIAANLFTQSMAHLRDTRLIIDFFIPIPDDWPLIRIYV
jgi:hypothetical protein